MTVRLKSNSLLLSLALGAAFLAAGCPKKPASTPPADTLPPTPVEAPPLPQVEVPQEPEITRPVKEPVQREELDDLMRAQNEGRIYLRTVYFDFDKHDLKEEAIAILKANAAWLKAHPGLKVVVEGHCDERGTIEYNLELAAKRAHAVVDYLGSLGVEAGRMRPVPFGEERPVDPGHDESAWAKNRRGEFTLER